MEAGQGLPVHHAEVHAGSARRQASKHTRAPYTHIDTPLLSNDEPMAVPATEFFKNPKADEACESAADAASLAWYITSHHITSERYTHTHYTYHTHKYTYKRERPHTTYIAQTLAAASAAASCVDKE